MRQKVTHAIVTEQGVTFAVVSVRDNVPCDRRAAEEMISALIPIYGCQVVLMGERNQRYFGHQNIVNFLQRIHPSQLPWRDGYIEAPGLRGGGGAGGFAGGTEPEIDAEVVWHGASGAQYLYSVQAINQPRPSSSGNYILVRRQEEDLILLFFGFGPHFQFNNPTLHSWICAKGKGVSELHFRANPSEGKGHDEIDDLLAAFPDTYEPIGCQQRSPGRQPSKQGRRPFRHA